MPAMVSFGNLGSLRSYQLCEVRAVDMLGDLVSQFGPESWCSNQSCISVRISTSKSGGFDKFSLRKSISLVMRVLKTDVLWIVFEKSDPKPVELTNAFILLRQAQSTKSLPNKLEKPFNQKQVLFNDMVDIFDEKGVKFSHSECSPRMKHKSTGSGTQLLYDISEVVWKIGHCKTQLAGRSLWNKVPLELQNLMTF